MHSILELYRRTNNLNQAYLLEGDIKGTIRDINNVIEKILGAPIVGNSDYYVCDTEVFDVDEGSRLRQSCQTRSLSGGKRFFVIGAEVFLEKAQNALLKTLEEPIEGNHFFIIVNDKSKLLPTVVSRLIRVDNSLNKRSETNDKYTEMSGRFLKSTVADRIMMTGEIIVDGEEPRVQRSAVRNFILSLENVVFKKYREGVLDNVDDIGSILSGISKVSDYSNDPASASKLLLEYLSLICPRLEENKDK